jgi:hypothetical protein
MLLFFHPLKYLQLLVSAEDYLTFLKYKIHVLMVSDESFIGNVETKKSQDAVEMKKFLSREENKHLKRETLKDKFSP